jgi:hypothetical protein
VSFKTNHALVFVALGLFRLEKRVRTLRFFSRRPLLYTVPFVFALGNILILVFAGKTKQKNNIPRWWWPVVTAIVLAISGLYWGAIKALGLRFGDLVGVKIRIEDLSQDAQGPRSMVRDPDEALANTIDGSERRVIVQTSGWPARCGPALADIGNLASRYLF